MQTGLLYLMSLVTKVLQMGNTVAASDKMYWKLDKMLLRSSVKGTIGHVADSVLLDRDSNRDPDCYRGIRFMIAIIIILIIM